MTDPADRFLEAVDLATVRSGHPYGGLAFRRRDRAVCYAWLSRVDPRTVRIHGMFAPVRGGGRHAMALIVFLADLHGVVLRLTAASSVPCRMDSRRLVEWYRDYGFVGSKPDGTGGVPMARLPGRLFGPVCGSPVRREPSTS